MSEQRAENAAELIGNAITAMGESMQFSPQSTVRAAGEAISRIGEAVGGLGDGLSADGLAEREATYEEAAVNDEGSD